MTLTTPPHALEGALADCFASFRRFCDVVEGFVAGEAGWPELSAAWERHFKGPFAPLDQRIREAARAQRPEFRQAVPVSMSHHNLQRLMEVLETEYGGERPARIATRRVDDLQAVCGCLHDLLARVTGAQAREATDGSEV